MKKLVFSVLLLMLILFSGPSLFARDGAATIIYGDGYGFNLLREGEELYYDILYDDVIGVELFEGDYISTDESTFLEIQLTSSSNVLKISENTSFQIERISGQGGGRFALTYGRVRAKVDRLIGNDQFQIGGPGAVAGVRGTDFGYDIIAKREDSREDPVTIAQVYCFEGKVEVAKIVTEVEPEEVIVIEANQMVSLAMEAGEVPVKEDFQPRVIEEEINSFWDQNDFSGPLIEYPGMEVEASSEDEGAEPEEKKLEEEKPVKTVEEDTIFQEQEEVRKEKARKNFFAAGTTVIGIGALTEIAGILLYFFGPGWFGGDAGTYQDAGTVMMVAGGGIAVGGLLTYLGVLVNQ